MTNIRKIVFLSLACSVIPNLAQAGISTDFEETTRPQIFSHTGQDPVYKSTIGKEIFGVPLWKKEPLETDFGISLGDSLVQIVLSDDTLPSDFFQPTIGFVNEIVVDTGWTNAQAIGVETTFATISFGSNAPAPPAFLLLLGSVLARRRRN